MVTSVVDASVVELASVVESAVVDAAVVVVGSAVVVEASVVELGATVVVEAGSTVVAPAAFGFWQRPLTKTSVTFVLEQASNAHGHLRPSPVPSQLHTKNSDGSTPVGISLLTQPWQPSTGATHG